jgi:hypothetical protein
MHSYLCELAQFGSVGLAFLSIHGPDNRFDLILAPFHSLLGLFSRWHDSLNQDSRQAISKGFEVGLFFGGDHQPDDSNQISLAHSDDCNRFFS